MAKYSIREFAIEQESTPGTAETIVSADVVESRSSTIWVPEYDAFDLDLIQSTSSAAALSMGKGIATFTHEYVLRGPASTTTDPAVIDRWEAAMLVGAEASTIAVGTITGTYTIGEQINDGAGNTGRVVKSATGSDGEIAYIPLSGTLLTASTITGETSGATSTSSGGGVGEGYAFQFGDNATFAAGHHATCKGFLSNGHQVTARGCLGNISFEFENDRPVVVTQEFRGSISSHGDDSLFSPASLPEASNTPPRFQNTGIALGTYSLPHVVNLALNCPIGVEPVEDAGANVTNGIQFMDYDRRNNPPTITVAPSFVTAATFNYLTNLADGTESFMQWEVGGTTGLIWTFAAPRAQITSMSFSERAPDLIEVSLEMRLNGSSNDELFIWQH